MGKGTVIIVINLVVIEHLLYPRHYIFFLISSSKQFYEVGVFILIFTDEKTEKD